jgi:hypothetical protein
MKIKLAVLAISITAFVAACSGGGAGNSGNTLPPSVPIGSASGTVLDGLILNGTVTAYDYSNGVKGAVLGSATTDSRNGYYSLSIQVESRPILLEITGGYYNEEMDPSTNIPLDAGDKMQAVVNYTTGASITTSITAFTTAAAGLAAYENKNGTTVATAINNANHRFSNLVGLDIIKTTPLEITDTANASATLTPGLQYGFLAGGISMWVSKNYPNPTTSPAFQKPYISIKFVQLMYNDIATDGQLDGMGTDSNGNPVRLSFGNVPLSPTIYRQGIGVSMLQMADNSNNKTGLNSGKVLAFGQTYSGSTDPLWAGVAPVPITSPTVAITAPSAAQWVRGTVNVTATVQDYVGLSLDSLTIDTSSSPVSTLTTNLTSPIFPFVSTGYGDGAHTLNVTATNTVGMSSTASVQINVDNTPPTILLNPPVLTSLPLVPGGLPYPGCRVSGAVGDAASGVGGSLSWSWMGMSGSAPIEVNYFTANLILTPLSTNDGHLTITTTDRAGNTTTMTRTLYMTRDILGHYNGCVLQ